VFRAIVFEKWSKEIEQGTTDLPEKIELLKKMKDVAMTIPLIQNFYRKLEDVKKDFLIELTWDEMNEEDEKNIREDLEKLVGAFIDPFEETVLSTGKTFATEWIDATDQEQRDKTLNYLVNELMNKLIIKINKETARGANISMLALTIRSQMKTIRLIVYYLGDLISPRAQKKIVEILDKTNEKLDKKAKK